MHPKVWSNLDQLTQNSYYKAMKVVSIYEAKTQFSKLIKRANQGEVIYVGAYGKPMAVLAPLPHKKTVKFGLFAHKADPNFDYDSIVESDDEITKSFEEGLLEEEDFYK